MSLSRSTGKYRYRTRLRELLPWGELYPLVPKGRDCGDHDWYRSTDRVWRCYHCRVKTTVIPWTPAEVQERCDSAREVLGKYPEIWPARESRFQELMKEAMERWEDPAVREAESRLPPSF